MADLKEIQNTELEILCFFDETCTRLDLRYCMVGGTMLGAVRHRGFIPWDDDVDLYMPLEDAEKLEKGFLSDSFFLQTPRTDPQMPYLYFKVRKNGTIMEGGQDAGLSIHKGVWIDVFFYTPAGKSRLARKMQMTAMRALQSFRCRHYHAIRSPERRLHVFLTKLPLKLCLALDSFLLGIIRLLGSNKSDEYLTMDVCEPFFQKKVFFDSLARYSFEDQSFWGPEDYDGFLSSYYGPDYMIPKKWSHLGSYSDVVV